MVPDHHEVTGALGAAAIAAERAENLRVQSEKVQSSFRGFNDLVSVDYQVESFTCEHCANNCEIKKVQSQLMDKPLYYGSRCDRYNLKKKTRKGKDLDAFGYRRRQLFEYAGLSDTTVESSSSKVTIGMPMALINWQLLPLFSQFLKSLGFEVVLSGKSNKRTIRRGVELVTAQPCFPVKVAYGHVAELIDKKVDYIFLPSIVSMTGANPEHRNSQLCPYIQSFVYQAQGAFADKFGQSKILSAVIRMGDGDKLMEKSFMSLGKKLGAGRSAVRKAFQGALTVQKGFDKALTDKGAEILKQVGPGEKLFVLVSRPYNGCDDGLNLELPKKLAELGVETIPMDMLDLKAVDPGDQPLHRDAYWTYGQKILRAAEAIRADKRLFAIYLSNFSCGPDSFLLTFFKDIMSPKPCLQLELDEHSADAGVITRLEAYLESLKNYREMGKGPVVKTKAKATSAGKRMLYLPYMSDCAYGIAASFRAHGQPAEVMELADEAALLRGRAYTTGKECLPCAITTGDMLTVIEGENFDPDKVAFFMPSSSGPCRFGMYNCAHKMILRDAGLEQIPVISPNQDSGFYGELAASVDGRSGRDFMKDIWTATVGIDLLQKVILRLRPFAADPDRAQQVYELSVRRWIQAVEGRWPLSKKQWLMDTIGEDLARVELNYDVVKPRIGIVGEIYVRNHPFANNNIVAHLEQLGAACDLAPLAEWIYYTNYARRGKAKRAGRMRDLLANVFQDYFQHRIEKALAGPLEKRFGPLAEEPLAHVLELASPYVHRSLDGEAVLSIGKTVEYHHKGLAGVINVMPFGCMPSTIVSTLTMRLSADCGDMPILNLSFDGQEDPTLPTCLEAFVECARARATCVDALSIVS